MIIITARTHTAKHNAKRERVRGRAHKDYIVREEFVSLAGYLHYRTCTFAKALGRRLLLRPVKERVRYKRLCEHKPSSLALRIPSKGEEPRFRLHDGVACAVSETKGSRATGAGMRRLQTAWRRASDRKRRLTGSLHGRQTDICCRQRKRAMGCASALYGSADFEEQEGKKRKKFEQHAGDPCFFARVYTYTRILKAAAEKHTSPPILVPLSHAEPNRRAFGSSSCLARC